MAKKQVTTTELIKTTITETTIEEHTLPTLEIIEGKIFCTSLQVAEHFEKDHKNVLRDIEEQIAKIKAGRHAGSEEGMFLKGFEEVPNNLGFKVKKPMYYLNRDGFTKLIMGYNGTKASDIQMDYIEAFNKMEAFIKQQQAAKPTTITNAQYNKIRDLIYHMSRYTHNQDQTVSKLMNYIRFETNIEHVKDLPSDRFESVMTYLQASQQIAEKHLLPILVEAEDYFFTDIICKGVEFTGTIRKKMTKRIGNSLPKPINWKEAALQLEALPC